MRTIQSLSLIHICAPKFEELAKEGKDKEITILHFGLWFVHYALYALIPFFAVLFGSDAVSYTHLFR